MIYMKKFADVCKSIFLLGGNFRYIWWVRNCGDLHPQNFPTLGYIKYDIIYYGFWVNMSLAFTWLALSQLHYGWL